MNDTGPVSIITDDPTCAPWRPIAETIANQERNGWDKRDPSIPETAWTAEQRTQYEAVAQAMRTAADQTVALAKMTPHRVMRELYGQTIAYWRAYANSIPSYTAPDNHLIVVANSTSAALNSICSAIDYRSAAARGPLAGQASEPSHTASIEDPADPGRFLTEPPNPVCADWTAASTQFKEATADWRKIDASIPASEWAPEQRTVNEEVAPVMLAFADTLEDLGQRSGNAVLDDFAALAAQYRRAYVKSLPSYIPADNFLSDVSTQLVFTVNEGCLAAGS